MYVWYLYNRMYVCLISIQLNTCMFDIYTIKYIYVPIQLNTCMFDYN